MGQKGTVLLKIFLAEGDHPLIIDQPEENLDNKFVYEALVDAFREAKKRRQIIIATHNANLVVNTDAEQVIVAEFKDSKILYRWGSIENPNIRKNITALLEGGEEAFRNREMKYGI
jgi:predicted ATPase